MRMTHIFSALMVATTIGVTAAITGPTTVQAQAAKTSLAAFPKSIRGTWYHYEENNGYYYKTVTIGAKKMTVKNYFDAFGKKKAKWTGTLHTTKNQDNDFRQGWGNKKSHWTSAKSVKGGYTKVVAYGMFATNGGGTYKVIHKTYKGKSVKVLYNKAVVKNWGKQLADHYYQTKAQAKFFNPVGALHK
jgi:hypothetical protein